MDSYYNRKPLNQLAKKGQSSHEAEGSSLFVRLREPAARTVLPRSA